MSGPRRRIAAAGVVGIVVMLVLSGCATASTISSSAADLGSSASAVPLSQLTPLADPKSYVGPSTAVLDSSAIVPVEQNPSQSLPATITSKDPDGDVSVTVTDTSRIVPMDIAGTIATTVFALGFGGSVVGRDESTSIPGAEDLPVVTGSSHSINAEAVLALNPTLVITDGTIGPRDVVTQLRDAGVTVVFVSNTPSIEGPAQLARDVSAVLGAAPVGDELATKLSTQITNKVAEIAALAPKENSKKLRIAFLYLRGASGIYYLFGKGSGSDVLINALGGVDVATEIGWVGEKPMTAEALAAADPDLILVMTKGLESVGGVDGLLSSKPEVAITTAGENRRFVDMADAVVLGFGPRLPDVLDALARAIYAPE